MDSDSAGATPNRAECPRCHREFEVGAVRFCPGCGLALGADGGLPFMMGPDSTWPEAPPEFNPKQMLRSLLAFSAFVLTVLAVLLTFVSLATRGPGRDAALNFITRQPEVVANLGTPASLLFATGGEAGSARDMENRSHSYHLVLRGPSGVGLASVDVDVTPMSTRIERAAFRTFSGSWTELNQRQQRGVAPAPVATAIQNARALVSEEMYRPAIAVIDHALAIDPGWAESWYWRAVAMEALGDTTQAKEDLQRALELGYAEPEAVSRYVELLPEEGRVQAAIQAWQAFLSRVPDHPNGRVELAFAHLAAGDAALARPTFATFCNRGHARACEGLAMLDAAAETDSVPDGP